MNEAKIKTALMRIALAERLLLEAAADLAPESEGGGVSASENPATLGALMQRVPQGANPVPSPVHIRPE